jgi:hypothetical protein
MDQPIAYRLWYMGWLPRINGHEVNRFGRSRLVKLGRRIFGVLPPCAYATTPAIVTIRRVLGPEQRPMDDDSISLLTGGLRDALKHGGYIRDDSPRWATFVYENDASRRTLGPFIEILIRYQEIHHMGE